MRLDHLSDETKARAYEAVSDVVHARMPTPDSMSDAEAIAWILAVVENTEKPDLNQLELPLPLAA